MKGLSHWVVSSWCELTSVLGLRELLCPQLAHPTVVPVSLPAALSVARVSSVDWILKEAVWTTFQPQVLSLT